MQKLKTSLFISVIVMALLAVCFVGFSFGTGKAFANDKDTNIVYDSVEKIIEIDEQKVCNITEIITVTYTQAGINVGLVRNISRTNKITRIVNGKKYVKTTKNKLKLLSVTMDDKPEYNFLETSSDYYYINTGADFDYKVGQHTYKFNYLYDMGDDFINAFDDFTFDLMDYDFGSPVDSFSAKITLPKAFVDEGALQNALSFRTNEMAPLSYEEANLDFDESSLSISVSRSHLHAGEGLTMQLILPEGYFDAKYKPIAFYYVLLVISVVCALAITAIIYFSRKGKKVVITPEFYPPEGYSPLSVARAYRGQIKPKDFAALVIDWHARGLVSIRLKGKKHMVLTKLKEFEIVWKKEIALQQKQEKDYFNALFSGKKKVYDTKTEKHKVNKRLSHCVKALYEKDPTKKKKVLLLRMLIHVLATVPFLFFLIWAQFALGGSAIGLIFIIIFPIIAILVFTYVPMPWLFKIIWCSGFGGMPLAAVVAMFNSVYDILHLIWFVLAIFLVGSYAAKFIRAFTEEEQKVRGRILGFKQFLVKAELDKLNALLEDNPEYYYNILPYCYVFGITKKMESKFAALHVVPPEYCNGASTHIVCAHICHSMSRMGGGVSSGGGGHSGGGGGGGGSSGGGGGGGGCHGR